VTDRQTDRQTTLLGSSQQAVFTYTLKERKSIYIVPFVYYASQGAQAWITQRKCNNRSKINHVCAILFMLIILNLFKYVYFKLFITF